MQFGDFQGNAALKASLTSAFSRRRLPHTLILEGEAGLGKRTLARILANAVVCRADTAAAPCGQCPSCVRFAAGSHPDIRIITGSGASNAVNVESVENVLRDAYRRPEEADVSVYLFFIENGISDAAQNKLLKLIEEPPPGVLFIFTVPRADLLLPTVRSRAQIFALSPVEERTAAAYAAQRAGITEERALFLAALHRGNIGRMLSEGEAGLSQKAVQIACEMARAVATGTEHELLAAAAPLIKDKPLFTETVERLALLLRDACMLKNGVETVSAATRDTAELLSRRLTLKSLTALCTRLPDYAAYRERNANMTLLVTALCARLAEK